MVCWHNRYTLGDEQSDLEPLEYMAQLINEDDSSFDINEIEEEFFANKDWSRELQDEWDQTWPAVVTDKFDELYYSLPLYLYDHGGLSISTGPFSCPWDSGQVGFIYLLKSQAQRELSHDYPIDSYESLEQHVYAIMREDVKTYDQYLRGEVYRFVLFDADGEEVDSCWGFYGGDYKTNGIAEHVDIDTVKEVHWMEPQTHTVMEAGDVECLA